MNLNTYILFLIISGDQVYARETGSALSLGSVGTRRTVYLPEDDSSPPAVSSTSTNQTAAPMLVYNRISTVIGETSRRDSLPTTSLPTDDTPREPERKKPENAKESAIWYEYGCV